MILFTGAMGNRDMAGGLLLLCVYLGAVFARIDTLLPRLPLLCGQTRWTALPGGLLLLSSAVALLVLYDCITPPGQPPMAPPAACNSSHLGRKPPAYIFFLAVFAGQTIGRVLQVRAPMGTRAAHAAHAAHGGPITFDASASPATGSQQLSLCVLCSSYTMTAGKRLLSQIVPRRSGIRRKAPARHRRRGSKKGGEAESPRRPTSEVCPAKNAS